MWAIWERKAVLASCGRKLLIVISVKKRNDTHKNDIKLKVG
jgi:hypothetical protein